MAQTQSQDLTPQQVRDIVLTEELLDLLDSHRETENVDLSVKIDGAVAHVQGEVKTQEELQAVRTVLRQLHGLQAVWDVIEVTGEELVVGDFGCGGKKQFEFALGVDQFPSEGVEVVTNLEEELPFDDDVFDHIFMVHVVEHIHDLVGLMNELHRVLKPQGIFHLLTPFWKSVTAIGDPTHVRFMHPQSFKYFSEIHPGMKRWEPLMVTATEDTVFADLTPVPDDGEVSIERFTKWYV